MISPHVSNTYNSIAWGACALWIRVERQHSFDHPARRPQLDNNFVPADLGIISIV
jgi:hypothetical protein